MDATHSENSRNSRHSSTVSDAVSESEESVSDPESHRPEGWLSGMLVLSSFTVISRILGLIRDMAMAKVFGLSPIMDAFTIAFRIPNLSRKLFGEGALTTAFVPLFVRELQHSDRHRAWNLASAVFGWLTIFLTLIVALGEISLLIISQVVDLAPGTRLMIELTAWMFPYLVLICLSSQISSVLNSLGQFRWPATVPLVLNGVWLVALWFIVPWFSSKESQARILALCILVSGFLQLLIQTPSLRSVGFRFSWDWKSSRERVQEILRNMLPVVLGLSVTQINTLSDSLIAWSFSQPPGRTDATMPIPGSPLYPLSSGAVSALYYGERMYQFPLGVFGVALGTAIFPLLARHAARGDHHRLAEDLCLGLRLVLVIGLPASAALMWLSQPIARLLFERGEFGPAETLRTAWMIAAYGSAVWAYCGLLILQRAFYAVGDRTTPLRTGMLSTAINLVLNLTLIWIVGEWVLAASTAVCAILQLAVLCRIANHQFGRLDWRQLAGCAMRTTVATLIMSLTGMWLIQTGSNGQYWTGKLASLLIPATVSGLVYLGLIRILGIQELQMIWSQFRNRPKANRK